MHEFYPGFSVVPVSILKWFTERLVKAQLGSINLMRCTFVQTAGFAVFTIFVATRASLLFAAGTVEHPLSLAEALDLAGENSPDLRFARAAMEGAQADTLTAREVPNPQLTFNSNYISLRDAGGGGSLGTRPFDSYLRLDQLIERGGKRKFRIRSAREGERAAELDFNDELRLVRANVAVAYYALKYAQDNESIAVTGLQLQQQSLDAARRRLKAGDIAPLDEIRWEIEVARSESDLASARAARQDAQVALASVVGVSPATDAFLAADDWPPATTWVPPSSPLDERPDLQAAEARRRKAAAAVDIARALQTHDVTVGVQLEHYPQPGSDTNTFGVGFSIPLFVWHRYEGELRRTLADARLADETVRRTQLAADGERARAAADLDSARARVQRVQGEVLDKARLAAQAAEYAYQRGALGITDLLDARRAFTAVQLDALAARAAFANALTSWNAAAGPARASLAVSHDGK